MQRPYRPRNSNRREPVVEDLREKLNRIKQEKANSEVGSKNPPPPDPAYNFLKDPLRGDNCAKLVNEKKVGNKDQNLKYEVKCENKSDVEQKNPSKPNEKSPRENRKFNFDKTGEPGVWRRQNWKNHTPRDEQQPRKWKDKTAPQQSTKQQSVNNIKVVVSNESGERKCTIDKTVLVEIPVLAKKNYTVKTNLEKWSQKGPQKYYSDKNKQKSLNLNKGQTEENADNDEQLQTDTVNKNEHQTMTPNESVQKDETDEQLQTDTVNKNEHQTMTPNESVQKDETDEQLQTDTVSKNEHQTMTPNESVQKNETDEQLQTDIDNKNEHQTMTPIESVQKNETDEQLQTDTVNKNEQTVTPNESSQKEENIVNNNTDKLAINKESSQIVVNDNKTEKIDEQQKLVETVKGSGILSSLSNEDESKVCHEKI